GGLERVLQVLRRDVLAAGGDDDVLLAVGERQEAVRVELAHVAGAEPPVWPEHLPRGLRILVVAGEDRRRADEHLAVLGEAVLEREAAPEALAAPARHARAPADVERPAREPAPRAAQLVEARGDRRVDLLVHARHAREDGRAHRLERLANAVGIRAEGGR